MALEEAVLDVLVDRQSMPVAEIAALVGHAEDEVRGVLRAVEERELGRFVCDPPSGVEMFTLLVAYWAVE